MTTFPFRRVVLVTLRPPATLRLDSTATAPWNDVLLDWNSSSSVPPLACRSRRPLSWPPLNRIDAPGRKAPFSTEPNSTLSECAAELVATGVATRTTLLSVPDERTSSVVPGDVAPMPTLHRSPGQLHHNALIATRTGRHW
jgi:hypothetical protein